MALEYDRSKRYPTLIFKFIDLNYSVVFDVISARRKNLAVGGFPTGPSLLVSRRVEAISVHVITGI